MGHLAETFCDLTIPISSSLLTKHRSLTWRVTSSSKYCRYSSLLLLDVSIQQISYQVGQNWKFVKYFWKKNQNTFHFLVNKIRVSWYYYTLPTMSWTYSLSCNNLTVQEPTVPFLKGNVLFILNVVSFIPLFSARLIDIYWTESKALEFRVCLIWINA